MKKIIILLLTLALVFTTAGCSGKDTTGGETGGKTTVTIWTQFADHQLDTLNEIIAEFNASQDKYEVVAEQQAKDNINNIAQAVSAQVGPDLAIEYGTSASSWHEDGLVVDLKDKLAKETIDNLIDSAYAYATDFDDGGMYICPTIGTGTIMWYCADIMNLIDQPMAETWDELFALAKNIHDNVLCVSNADGSKTYALKGTPEAEGGTEIVGFACDADETLREVMEQTGGMYDVASNKVLFNNDAVIDWLTKFKEGCEAGYLAPMPQEGYANNDMNKGILAIGSGSVAGRPYYKECGEVWSYHVPQTVGSTKTVTNSRSRGWIVLDNGDEDKIAGAIAFIDFFQKPENNFRLVKEMNYYAVLKDTIALEEYQEYYKSNPDMENVMAEYGSTYPNIPVTKYIQEALKNCLSSVASGTEPAKALQTAEDFINSNK